MYTVTDEYDQTDQYVDYHHPKLINSTAKWHMYGYYSKNQIQLNITDNIALLHIATYIAYARSNDCDTV